MEAPRPKLKLYKADWCGYCVRVMRVLDKLGLDYEGIEVPIPHSAAPHEVLAISGQPEVPRAGRRRRRDRRRRPDHPIPRINLRQESVVPTSVGRPSWSAVHS